MFFYAHTIFRLIRYNLRIQYTEQRNGHGELHRYSRASICDVDDGREILLRTCPTPRPTGTNARKPIVAGHGKSEPLPVLVVTIKVMRRHASDRAARRAVERAE